jgi:hypothetical protein
MRVAFVGLGVMGFPMAGHLRAKGHEVTVWNRTREKALAWRERHGGSVAESPRAAAKSASMSEYNSTPGMCGWKMSAGSGMPSNDLTCCCSILFSLLSDVSACDAGR